MRRGLLKDQLEKQAFEWIQKEQCPKNERKVNEANVGKGEVQEV